MAITRYTVAVLLLGMPYPEASARIVALMEALPAPGDLVVDATGVGRPARGGPVPSGCGVEPRGPEHVKHQLSNHRPRPPVEKLPKKRPL